MYNKCIMAGRFTDDPELRQTPSGVSVTTFTLAVDRAYSKGEKQTDFIEFVAWRKTAEFIARYFTKGQAILVEGNLQVRTYTDKNNQKRKAWEIIVDNANFIEKKKSADVVVDDPGYAAGAAEDFAEIEDDGSLPF